MNALRRQNIRPQQTFERWTPRTQESPRELARQSKAKRKQVSQSEADVCRQRKCNLNKTSLINCTGHPIMHPTQIRGGVLVPRTQWFILTCHKIMVMIAWSSTYPTRLKSIFMIQKKVVRIMTFSSYRKETKAIFTSLKIMNIYELVALFTYFHMVFFSQTSMNIFSKNKT